MEVIFFSKKVGELRPIDIREMYSLYEKYYTSVSFDLFVSDLHEKTHVLILKNKSGEWVGFSTIFLKRFPDLTRGQFLYSGDTVVREDFWGTKYLQKAFFYFIVKTKLKSPIEPLYWMLISKGYKTYLMMIRNFKNSWPRKEQATPWQLKRIQKEFYEKKFGSFYNAYNDLIVFDKSRGEVKGGIAVPSGEALHNSDVDFFVKRNPRYFEGQELACLAEIRWRDFLIHITKYFLPRVRPKMSGEQRFEHD